MFTIVFLIIIKIIDLNLTKIMVRTHYLDYMIQNQDLKSKIFLQQETISNLMNILLQLKNI